MWPRLELYCNALLQATVLEEMPPFPERESSILAKLKKKKGPGNLPGIDDVRRNVNGSAEHSQNAEEAKKVPKGPITQSLSAFHSYFS